MKNLNIKKGVGVVEILISISLIFMFIVSLSLSLQFYLITSLDNSNNLKASFMLEEGVEALKVLRDISWSTHIDPLSTVTTYYINYSAGAYSISSTPSSVDGLTRSFTISDVDRDADDDIADAGTGDDRTKKIDMAVSWYSQKSKTDEVKTLGTYIHDLYEN